MTINLASLQKLETLPASEAAVPRANDEPVVVLVKLRKGAFRPDYVRARGEISSQIFSAEMPASDLRRLEVDPAVESVSLARQLPILR